MKNFKKWLAASCIRALKTFAQTAVGMLTGDLVGILEVNWISVLSVSATAAVLSLLTSVAGLPELEVEPEYEDTDDENAL